MSAHLSTKPLHVQAKGRAVQSLYRRGLTWVSFRPLPDAVCSIDFRIRKLPAFGLLSGVAQGVVHEHCDEQADIGDDDFSLHLNVSGISVIESSGCDLVLRDGDAVLLRYSRPRKISRPGAVCHRIVRLPRAQLAPLVPNLDDAVLHRIPSGSGTLGLLATYIAALIHDPSIEKPEIQKLVGSQLCDLVAFNLRPTRDTTAVAEGRGIRAARLYAIKCDIEAHLIQSGLSPASVARRQNISESYIRKLFESEGTSFSEFVLIRRLARAFRCLNDFSLADRTISSVAFECGFGDLSYFNRTFKRRYGATPSDIRDSALRR